MSLYHPDLAPYDARCDETTAALDAARKRYQAAVEELRAATVAHATATADDREANVQWAQACEAFRTLHRLPTNADLSAERTRHLPVHG